jgi:hypothetical protein
VAEWDESKKQPSKKGDTGSAQPTIEYELIPVESPPTDILSALLPRTFLERREQRLIEEKINTAKVLGQLYNSVADTQHALDRLTNIDKELEIQKLRRENDLAKERRTHKLAESQDELEELKLEAEKEELRQKIAALKNPPPSAQKEPPPARSKRSPKDEAMAAYWQVENRLKELEQADTPSNHPEVRFLRRELHRLEARLNELYQKDV